MCKHKLILAAAALVLATTVAGATAQTPAQGATNPVTISPEELHRSVDIRSLPLTYVEEPY